MAMPRNNYNRINDTRNPEMYFGQLDTNGNGVIDAKDHIDKAILQELGIVDASGNNTRNTISKEEFKLISSEKLDKIINALKLGKPQEPSQPQESDTIPTPKESISEKFNNAKPFGLA